ncbi:sterol regulatory element binding protein Sre1 [Plectosphaerella plurivora]|uniref:Sterol regulatory element binding protein Sre1 n=1 Tax=Plectosphaerella plurivora TaxID=936078 RepID=A0A9P8VD47_9PEZI|nr:sterol regulatory element binding protein Sre1 [Plectosphaerella plurivora]
MADRDSGAIFGFDGADSSYLDDTTSQPVKTDSSSAVASASSNTNNSTGTADNQFLFDTSNWAYQDPPGYAFNFSAPSTAAAPSAPVFQTASWDLPFEQQQQQQQTPQGFYQNPAGGSIVVRQGRPIPQQQQQHLLQQQQQHPTAPPHLSAGLSGESANFLTPAQQEKLRNIAMPAHLQYHSPKSESSPPSGTNDGRAAPGTSRSSPDEHGLVRKRKSSAECEDDDDDDEDQPIKKTAHNMIEKRYRTNLNDKIAALRDSVPSLRIMSKSARGEDTTEDREELHGLTPAHKLNKATVLSKATEYIRHLEKRNNRLLDENHAMQSRIAAFEKLFMAGAMTGAMSPMQQPPTPMQYPQDPYISPPIGTPQEGQQAQGLMPVPEDMKRIISAQMAAGQPYPVPQQQFQRNSNMLRQQQIQQMQQGGRWGGNAGPYFGKLMVGSLAGLMIIEAVRTDEQSNDKPDGRGLFAIPMQLLNALGPDTHVHFAGHAVSAARIISHLKLLLFIGLCVYMFVPSLFAPSKKQKGQQQIGTLDPSPSPASPIHVRRQAWLTAIQTVWVPQHNFFLEAAALILKTMKLSLRNAIGVHGYQMLTGLTEEQEAARVQAWSIALDAQLAGGDVEINKSRLTLTLLASGTLPDTPLRLMLKALHIRVLLWDLGATGAHNYIASPLARSNWNEARRLQKALVELRRKTNETLDDELPEHLAALLERECNDVLNPSIIRRAYNLAWNLPTTENVKEFTDGMDLVVEDQAVRSPMDAVAAWWSTQEIHQAMTATLAAEEDDTTVQHTVKYHVDNALETAPIGSAAQARALVTRAVLVDEKRGASIASAMKAVQPDDLHKKLGDQLVTSILVSSLPASTTLDTQVALKCAMAVAHLQRVKDDEPPREAVQIVEKIAQPAITTGMSLLGCTALFKLMGELNDHPAARERFSVPIECLAGSLRIWIGSAPGERCGLDQELRHNMVDRCLSISKSAVGIETDTGYGSMSDCEEESGC